MKIFYPLPALPRNGGIKVCIQHSHLLNSNGHNCYIVLPGMQETPYKEYSMAKFISFHDMMNIVEEDDIFVFNWPPDIKNYLGLNNKFYYYSQGVINKDCPVDHTSYLNDRFELITIGKHSRDFYFYGYGKDSRIINNWINYIVFYDSKIKTVKNRVGMIKHRHHYDESIKEKIESNDFEVLEISGTESEVADLMRTCDYFVMCSRGVYNGHDYAEGFPLPGAEAMACGAILITYNNHGCLEYAFDKVNSFVAWENTPDDLISKLIEARNSPVKEEIRRTGCFTTRQRFNSEVVYNQIINALGLK